MSFLIVGLIMTFATSTPYLRNDASCRQTK